MGIVDRFLKKASAAEARGDKHMASLWYKLAEDAEANLKRQEERKLKGFTEDKETNNGNTHDKK